MQIWLLFLICVRAHKVSKSRQESTLHYNSCVFSYIADSGSMIQIEDDHFVYLLAVMRSLWNGKVLLLEWNDRSELSNTGTVLVLS